MDSNLEVAPLVLGGSTAPVGAEGDLDALWKFIEVCQELEEEVEGDFDSLLDFFSTWQEFI